MFLQLPQPPIQYQNEKEANDPTSLIYEECFKTAALVGVGQFLFQY